MQSTRRLALAIVLAAPLAGNFGCRTINPKSPFHGTMSCSCSGTNCNCDHCSGEKASCNCRGTDAMGDRSAVGEPGDSK